MLRHKYLELNVSVKQTIEEKLTAKFSPTMLEVIDQSHKHRGHVGSKPEGETHFHVNMNAQAFEGESRVARQRLVYDCLKEDLEGPVHALSLKLGTEE
ncbi:MAG: BolA family transcriptional regulator [Sphingomonadales bacterium]|nr:BolA family transcriptional regulator [Sphingomonadales bacterium]